MIWYNKNSLENCSDILIFINIYEKTKFIGFTFLFLPALKNLHKRKRKIISFLINLKKELIFILNTIILFQNFN
jgi:hypothetical protein